MRSEMAVGQLLDLEGAGSEASEAARVADLKTGGYTVEGPLHIGAILAGGSQEALACLSLFGAPLGRAFQLRDDLQDREEDGRPFGPSPGQVDELVDLAVSALDPRVLAHDAVGALSALAELVRP
jgi:geranylgeranyl pyrophosphate synthase